MLNSLSAKRILVGLVFGSVLAATLIAQSDKKPLRLLIDETTPGAYLTFVKTYLSDYKEDGESGTRAIFRMHNNYGFPITVNVYNVEDEDLAIGEANVKVNVVGVVYDLFESSGRWKPETVRHFGQEVMTMVEIEPRDDLFFSVPIEHLNSRSEIWIPFSIDAEVRGTKGGLPPQHFAIFWGNRMPVVHNQQNK